MNRKHFTIATVISAVLLTVVFIPLSGQQSDSYDPWLDYNEDGTIDIDDLSPLGQAYGSSGDTTKNVTVTNWPVERKLFPEYLTLKATRWRSERELLDETTAYPFDILQYDWVAIELDPTSKLIYNNTFIYQKPPTDAYQILGMPRVSLTFNVTNSPSATFYLVVYAYLGKISMSGEWTDLGLVDALGPYYVGINTENQRRYSLRPSNPYNIVIGVYERLAIRLLFYGWTISGTTDLTLKILFGKDADEFLVDIPIAEGP